VNRSGVVTVLIGSSSLGDSATLGGITGLYPGYIPTGWAEPGRAGSVGLIPQARLKIYPDSGTRVPVSAPRRVRR
jgi:hypothetical protein